MEKHDQQITRLIAWAVGSTSFVVNLLRVFSLIMLACSFVFTALALIIAIIIHISVSDGVSDGYIILMTVACVPTMVFVISLVFPTYHKY